MTRSWKRDVHKIAGFISSLAIRPSLDIIHVGASPFHVACVPGERIVPICLRRSFNAAPDTLDLFRFTRIVIDAVAKYSNKSKPQDNLSLLSLMSADPFYTSLIEDRSLTIRNYITSWGLFKKEIESKSGRTDIAISKRVGREAYYFQAN